MAADGDTNNGIGIFPETPQPPPHPILSPEGEELNRLEVSIRIIVGPLFGGKPSIGLPTRQWPVTDLMMLSDWTMSCQPGPPRARHGQ